MNVIELMEKLNNIIKEGNGTKQIYVESDNGDNLEINCVAKDTSPNVEAGYYFLMPGGRVQEAA